MIVIRDVEHFKVYYPRLTIRACLTLDSLFGDVTAPISTGVVSLENQCLILSLCLQEENLQQDEIYDILDLVDDPIQLIIDLFEEAGLISQDTEQNASEGQEMTNNDELEEDLTFSQHMDKLLESCMQIGMSEEEFMNSTLKQVTRYAETYQHKQRARLEEQAYLDYTLASLFRIGVASCIAKGVDYPAFYDAYPFIKEQAEAQPKDDRVGADGMTAEEREIELNRLKMMEWAEAMNAKRRKQQEEQAKQESETEV